MRHDTRKEILETAKRLFNERGYNSVSTGDIAAALGISKGNLTYYFKKKEYIIEAILTENSSTRTEVAPHTIAALNEFFKDIQKTVKENAFYFWHHTQFAQILPTIQSLQGDTLNKNISLLEQTFLLLKKDGMIRKEKYPDEYKRLIDTLLLCSIYWIPFCKLKTPSEDNFLEQTWSIIFPFLTAKGLKELKEVRGNQEMYYPDLHDK